ncbi:MAG: cohesin domain-containing protein, partial [Bacteroidota bacterium]
MPPPPKDWQPGTAKMDCNDAGELEGFTGFQMQSTSFGDNLGPADVIPFGGQPDTIFLCAQDQFTLNHREGTEDLDGDPDDTSTPGVGYAFFRCTPTTRGPTIQDIVADACLADNGLPPFDTLAIAVPTGFDNAVPDYSITVANDGTGNNTIPALFPVGGAPSPVVLTLTPITFDEVIVATGNAGYETPAGGGMFGPCANARVDQSFQVAYLNPVTTANLGVDPSSACNGLFDVRGGTPELRGGTGYNIRIVNTTTGREGVVLTPAADIVHDAVVRYQVPEAGTYEIIIEDENSCPLEMTTITHTEGCSLPVVFDFPFVTGENGQNICVNITAENFTDIAGFQFETAYDPAVVQYTGIANQHPDFSSPISANGPPSSGGTLPDGSVRITWSDFGASPLTIAADQTLFSLCFDIIGAEGEQTGLDFSQESGSIIPTFTRSGDPVMEDASSNPGAISITMNAFLLDLAREDESCIGSSDGSITATASGAPDPYTFSIRRLDTEINFRDPVTRSGNPAMATFSGLTVAQYAVRAEAADGGVVIDTIEVEEGIGIGVNIDVLNTPTCRGFSDAEIEAVVNDANGVIADPLAAGYTFTWADSDETGNIRTGLTSGIYNVTVVAPNGVCVANDQGQVAPASALRIRPDNPADAVSNATCSGAPDGSIEITADGGTGPYDFDWQGTLGVDND